MTDTTIFLRFPDEATFNSLLPQAAFRCRQCDGSGQVITRQAEGYYETVPDPEDPAYTVKRWVETAPAEYGPCPKCNGTGFQDRIDGETCSPLPAGITALSIIGPRSSGGSWDEQGNVITPPTIDTRWHVNALGTVSAEWQQYVIDPGPTTPDRVFG